MSEIINLIHKPLSDEDIHKILGYKCKIIKYSELSNYRDLDDLLPNLLDYFIILYELYLALKKLKKNKTFFYIF